MAITREATAVPSGNPTTSFTIVIPTVAVDDILWLVTSNGGASADPSVTDNDTGGNAWQKVAGTSQGSESGAVWWKRATSGTSAKTITCSGFTDSSAGVLHVYRGCDTGATPYELASAEANASGNETHAGFTPTVSGTMVILAIAIGDNLAVTTPACTDPGALTGTEKLSTGGLDTEASIWDAIKNNVNATGAFTWAMTNATSISIVAALKPLGDTPKADSDSGSGSDAASATAAIPVTDQNASATDDAVVSVPVADTDQNTLATDAAALTAALTASETPSGADDGALTATLDGTDQNATATEDGVVTVPIAGADEASSSDTATVTAATLADSESGSANEAAALSSTIADSDLNSGATEDAAVAIPVAGADASSSVGEDASVEIVEYVGEPAGGGRAVGRPKGGRIWRPPPDPPLPPPLLLASYDVAGAAEVAYVDRRLDLADELDEVLLAIALL